MFEYSGKVHIHFNYTTIPTFSSVNFTVCLYRSSPWWWCILVLVSTNVAVHGITHTNWSELNNQSLYTNA